MVLLRAMHEIRFFEDECARLFARGAVRGTTHLCQGQEAVAVGACRALRSSDTMTCTYRGHGATLAKGAPLAESFGEILGKQKGLCRGKGGSMHLTDVRVGALGSHAIVGAHLPIANGAAFHAVYRKTDDVHVCFFGEGSTNIGAFHEALNLAGIWRLPLVFVCENNVYGEYSHWSSTTPIEELASRAASYGMPGVRVDGNDLAAVHGVVGEAVARAREGEGATLVEALTYRHKGHSRTDPGHYRPREEVDAWLARDPLDLCAAALLERGVEQAELDARREAAALGVAEALERALASAAPDPAARLEHVWA